MRRDIKSYDVAIIGAGPVGCVTALAFAARGADVLLLEANPKACGARLAGEWLHPAAVEVLNRVGVDLTSSRPYATGRGFVVYPDDGSRPIALPYANGEFGWGLHHERLVDLLRAKVSNHPSIEYLEYAKATRIVGQNLTYQGKGGAMRTIYADQIVGAAGRSSVAHSALGIGASSGTYSRMAGVLLEDCRVPFEGFGHVILGALGPILMYRLSQDTVRVCMDVPLALRMTRDKEVTLFEAYGRAMPETLRQPFRRALLRGDISWATNQTRARVHFGRPGLALVGDAVGHHHPLTALGMTLGFNDGISLANASSFQSYRRERAFNTRVPEMLAVALYEVFADTSDEVIAIRRAVYDLWRESPTERFRTMRFLSGRETSPLFFGNSFLKAIRIATRRLVNQGFATSEWGHVGNMTEELSSRIRWLFAGALHLSDPRPTKDLPRGAEERYAGALRASAAKADVVELPSATNHAARTGQDRFDPSIALERGLRALQGRQDVDGSWEGEVSWCPILAAQYVLAWHVMGRLKPGKSAAIDEKRRRRLLLHFERTRLADGLWGLSEVSDPSLFVTTLVYVAARLLGVAADAPLLAGARSFFEREGGVVAIPSWGKVWLAILSLYEWSGVNPVVPELWSLPERMPVHPSNFYSHTRHAYLAMAVLYAERFQTPVSTLIEELRGELYPQGYHTVDFSVARSALRREDLFAEPSRLLQTAYDALAVFEKTQSEASRRDAVSELRASIRWELSTTSHTSLSPVSGLFNLLALYVADEGDSEMLQGLENFNNWIWEDDKDGARVAGARSAIWDTGFAMQALSQARSLYDVEENLARADRFLAGQQIRTSFPGFEKHYRIDPCGGFPLSWGWHGWPVSDATAEAVIARTRANVAGGPADDDLAQAAEFILRAQSPDGGFGSYEPKRMRISLDWMNPAEMFGDAMTEHSHVECTASALIALSTIARERPQLLRRPSLAGLPQAIERAIRHLRVMQKPEGCWQGAWGVHFIYGTMFGIRGLLGAGIPATDPAIRKATAWLKLHQRPDGSWGERHAVHATAYVEHDEGQVVQTAWAMSALLEAHDPDWDALERAARFLARAQLGCGEWPKQAPHGVFFHTAVLDYALYRSYFPVLALSQYEARRRERTRFLDEMKRGMVAAE
ncbi:MAG: FAD-dependent oxidoreductase [Polyangiaceae bacterium]